jgi:hypothetical protein
MTAETSTTGPVTPATGPRYEYSAIEGLTMDQLQRLGHAGWKVAAVDHMEFHASGVVKTWGLAIHTL